MFNTVIDAIKGFLSKSFWFASFLPVAVVGMLHLTMVLITWPDLVSQTSLVTLAGDAIRFPILVVGLIVLAYALTPLIPVFRGLLDGSLLPDALHDALHREHTRRVRAARDAIDAAMQACNDWGQLNNQLTRLWDARALGVAVGTAANQTSLDAAEAALRSLRTPVENVEVPPVALGREAFDRTVV